MRLKGFIMQLPEFTQPDQISSKFVTKVDFFLLHYYKLKNIILFFCNLVNVLFKLSV